MKMDSSGQKAAAELGAWVDYRARINVVTSHIHSHIDGELQLEHLAGLAGFSPFHFHRIFAALMGETVAEFVRRVRLGLAVQRLLHSDEPVSEIALAVGYETPAAFSKAFRQRFQIAPTRLRGMDRVEAYALLLERPRVRPQRGHKIDPEIRMLPDQRVLYARSRGMIGQSFNQTANNAFRTLMAYLHEHSLMDTWTVCVGITPDDPNIVPREQCRFDAGVVLKEGVHVDVNLGATRCAMGAPASGRGPTAGESPARPYDGNVGVQVLAGGRWAVFQHRGPYDTLWQTWNAVDRDWLPASGVALRDAPPVEVYLDDPRRTKPEELRTEILIPVV